ncbi:MAG: hypothetical protein ACOCXA_00640 [Planctomycetota bacterium]
MINRIRIDDTILHFCREIMARNLDEETWADHEACDTFQTDRYCGGFDSTEMAFCFGVYDELGEEQYCFKFRLEQVPSILKRQITVLETYQIA